MNNGVHTADYINCKVNGEAHGLVIHTALRPATKQL